MPAPTARSVWRWTCRASTGSSCGKISRTNASKPKAQGQQSLGFLLRDGARPRASRRMLATASIAFAATPDPPAASGVADDLQVIRRSKDAAAGPGRRVFYPRPGQELGLHFRASARKITTYKRRPE
jgi:hypothetical protein